MKIEKIKELYILMDNDGNLNKIFYQINHLRTSLRHRNCENHKVKILNLDEIKGEIIEANHIKDKKSYNKYLNVKAWSELK